MMNNKNNEVRDGKHNINEGYQPSQKGYKPNYDNTSRPNHEPVSSGTKPVNPPKKR